MIFNKKTTFIEFMKNNLKTLNEFDTDLNGLFVMKKNATFNPFRTTI